ncbi:ISL3 family transposase [Nitrolancea hollandica]|uniref:Transposase n=1 Tax=Nitrolancea hollandica Lb TaxID=1129897 RepID=I4EGW0_9BACT
MLGPTQLLIPPELHVDALTAAQGIITITAHTTALTARCPHCQQSSSHLHSHYVRVLADVPWCGVPVRLQVTVRRFRCRNAACRQRIFAERLDDVATVYARRTDRLSAALELIGFALGGEAGARLATGLGFDTSPDTLLRVVRQADDPIGFPVTVCGVDDWAWRKGHRYGTLLVDLERHRVVDLLPDRSAAGFAAWLQRHPSIAVISRDRGESYAVGATQGAPDAVQVADRFHLVKNLGETLERVLKRHVRLLQQVPLPRGELLVVAPPRADREAGRMRTRQKMRERFDTIQKLADAGLSQRAIARTAGWSCGTVRASR